MYNNKTENESNRNAMHAGRLKMCVRKRENERERWKKGDKGRERYVVKWAGFPLGLRLGVCGLAASVVIVILAEFIMNRR